MNKTKNKNNHRSKAISLLLISMVSLEMYFFHSFLTKGLLVHYGYSIENLSSIIYLIILIILMVITMLSISLIIYGFIAKKSWTIKLALIYVIWAMLWLIWGAIVGSQVIENMILLGLYGLMMTFLVSSYVKEYFIFVSVVTKKKISNADTGI